MDGKSVHLAIETPEYEIAYTGKKKSKDYEPDRSITASSRAAIDKVVEFCKGPAIDALVAFHLEAAKEWHLSAQESSGGIAPLSEEGFRSRVSLESITLYPDGGAEMWYSDGGMFWGHSLNLTIDPSMKVVDSGMHG